MQVIAASEGQLEVLDALVQHGTLREAATATGLSEGAVERRMQRLRARTGLTTVQLAHRLGARRVRVTRPRQLRLWDEVAG